MANGDAFVTTRRAALNMCWQDMTPTVGEINILAEVQGSDLMGIKLKAPLTSYVLGLGQGREPSLHGVLFTHP